MVAVAWLLLCCPNVFLRFDGTFGCFRAVTVSIHMPIHSVNVPVQSNASTSKTCECLMQGCIVVLTIHAVIKCKPMCSKRVLKLTVVVAYLSSFSSYSLLLILLSRVDCICIGLLFLRYRAATIAITDIFWCTIPNSTPNFSFILIRITKEGCILSFLSLFAHDLIYNSLYLCEWPEICIKFLPFKSSHIYTFKQPNVDSDRFFIIAVHLIVTMFFC